MTATLNTTVIQNASSSTPNITLDTAGNAAFGGMPYGTSSFLRNRIINGAMMISQRGTSFSNPANQSYTLDRWLLETGGTTVASVAQVAGTGSFKNALQITGASGNTGTYIDQRIESVNCSDLSGQTVTVQANITVSSNQTVFWQLAYANSVDNFNGGVTNIANGTFSATTTPTTFTFTVTNLPSGATNGLKVTFSPNNQSGFTSGTFTITGVQLEQGSIATPFERRQYGEELMLCQRYFETCYPTGTAPGTGSIAKGSVGIYQNGLNSTTLSATMSVYFKATKRTTPTITCYAPSTGASGYATDQGNSNTNCSVTAQNIADYGFQFNPTTSNSTSTINIIGYWTASAEL